MCSGMGDGRSVYSVLVGKPKGDNLKDPGLGRIILR
jgi:hypothetical protein